MAPEELATGLHYNVRRSNALRLIERVDAQRIAEADEIPADVLAAAGASKAEISRARVDAWKAKKIRQFRTE